MTINSLLSKHLSEKSMSTYEEGSDVDAVAVTGCNHQGQKLGFHSEESVGPYPSNAFKKVTM